MNERVNGAMYEKVNRQRSKNQQVRLANVDLSGIYHLTACLKTTKQNTYVAER